MLGLDIANLTTMLMDSGILDSSIEELVSTTQYLIVGQDPNIQSSLKNHVARWQEYIRFRLTKVSQMDRFKNELELYQHVVYLSEDDFFQHIEASVNQLENLSVFYTEAKRLLDDKHNIHNPMFPHYFCERWYLSLENEIRQAQLSELEEHKKELLDDLYQRMKTLEEMESVDEENDSTPQSAKRLWNMASTKLSKSDISVIKKYASFLKKHNGLKEIAELLGRKAKETFQNKYHEEKYVDSVDMIEEKTSIATDDIMGIHQKDDINRLLPNELLFLSNPELDVVFYKHLIDKQLLNYQLCGKKQTLKHVVTRKKTSDEEETKEGPFIVCIDASGSMQGFPEQAAKALAYALMQIALASNRDCHVIIFSTQVIKYELTKQDGLREMSDFLSSTFHGGTDFQPVFNASLDLLEGEKYCNADLVVLSDFMAPKQNKELIDRITRIKLNGNRFHAVMFSKYGNSNILSVFDHSWSYHPSLFGRLVKRQ